MSKAVIALFDHIGPAQDAANALKAKGFADDRIQVLIGEEFLRRSQLPPAEHERGLWSGVRSFFDEIGLTPPGPRPEGEYQPIEADDGVILLETSDDRAAAAAAVLEEREGGVDIDARLEQKADPDRKHVASGLEPATSGRIPPELQEAERNGDIDERALASGRAGQPGGSRRHVRLYDAAIGRPTHH